MNKIKNVLLVLLLALISLNLKSQTLKDAFQVSELKNNRELKIEIIESFYRQLLAHPLLTDDNRSEVRSYYIVEP